MKPRGIALAATIMGVFLASPATLAVQPAPSGKIGTFKFPALAPGRWQLRWIFPAPSPRLDLQEAVSEFCYRQADQDADHDPVLPEAQRAVCKGRFSDTPGGDIVYASRCGENVIRTRLTPRDHGYSGTTSVHLDAGGPVESVVVLRRLGDC